MPLRSVDILFLHFFTCSFGSSLLTFHFSILYFTTSSLG